MGFRSSCRILPCGCLYVLARLKVLQCLNGTQACRCTSPSAKSAADTAPYSHVLGRPGDICLQSLDFIFAVQNSAVCGQVTGQSARSSSFYMLHMRCAAASQDCTHGEAVKEALTCWVA